MRWCEYPWKIHLRAMLLQINCSVWDRVTRISQKSKLTCRFENDRHDRNRFKRNWLPRYWVVSSSGRCQCWWLNVWIFEFSVCCSLYSSSLKRLMSQRKVWALFALDWIWKFLLHASSSADVAVVAKSVQKRTARMHRGYKQAVSGDQGETFFYYAPRGFASSSSVLFSPES